MAGSDRTARDRELMALLDAFQLDEVQRIADQSEICEAWIRYQLADHEPDRGHEDLDWWAVEVVSDSEGDYKLRLIESLAERMPDELLELLGAGPIEDELIADEARLAWVERCAAESPKFKKALASVWVWGFLPNEACQRIESASGVRLAAPEIGKGRDNSKRASYGPRQG